MEKYTLTFIFIVVMIGIAYYVGNIKDKNE